MQRATKSLRQGALALAAVALGVATAACTGNGVDVTKEPAPTAAARSDAETKATVGALAVASPKGASCRVAGTLERPRFAHTATLLRDGRVLVVGGQQHDHAGPRSPSAEIFDPKTGTSTPTSAMTVGRGWHAALALRDGRVLVVGGETDEKDGLVASAVLYDPARDAWTAAGAMRHEAAQPMLAELASGQVLVAGGNLFYKSKTHADAALFDPATRRWTPFTDMPHERAGHLVATRAGLVAVGGTLDWGMNRAASFDLLAPGASTWTTIATGDLLPEDAAPFGDAGALLVVGNIAVDAAAPEPMVGRVLDASGGVVRTLRKAVPALELIAARGEVYALVGDRIERWSPTADEWEPRAQLPHDVTASSTTVLAGGTQLLVAGGIVAGHERDAIVCDL